MNADSCSVPDAFALWDWQMSTNASLRPVQSVRRQLHADAPRGEHENREMSFHPESPMFVERDVHLARSWQSSNCPLVTRFRVSDGNFTSTRCSAKRIRKSRHVAPPGTPDVPLSATYTLHDRGKVQDVRRQLRANEMPMLREASTKIESYIASFKTFDVR